MSSAKSSKSVDLSYIKRIVSEVMGEELWNGFYDVVTTERPRIDMYDDGSTITLIAEAPGILNPQDVLISVTGNRLNIRGISKDKYQRNRPGKTLKSECLYGAFNRFIDLPCSVDENNIKAVYENGMLEIVIQKTGGTDDKTIEIEFKK